MALEIKQRQTDELSNKIEQQNEIIFKQSRLIMLLIQQLNEAGVVFEESIPSMCSN